MPTPVNNSLAFTERQGLYHDPNPEIIEGLQKLLNEQVICEHFDPRTDNVTYSLVSKSHHRNHNRLRYHFAICRNDVPILLVKFYGDTQSNAFLDSEFQIQKIMYKQYSNLRVPKPVALLKINGLNMMIEEICAGKTLDQQFGTDITPINFQQITNYATKVQKSLNENLTLSTFDSFVDEIDNLTAQFISLYKPTSSELSAIKATRELFVSAFSEKPIYKRYTNGDFTSSNILLDANNEPVLLDYEYAEETHLYFLEWFRFCVSINVPRSVILPIYSCYDDKAIQNVLSYLARLPACNNQVIKGQWLLFYMKDFISNCQIFPESDFGRLRRDLRFNLIALFTSSSVGRAELIRLAETGFFILKTYGFKGLYQSLMEKIRIKQCNPDLGPTSREINQ